jgi:hypothetical protein
VEFEVSEFIFWLLGIKEEIVGCLFDSLFSFVLWRDCSWKEELGFAEVDIVSLSISKEANSFLLWIECSERWNLEWVEEGVEEVIGCLVSKGLKFSFYLILGENTFWEA